MADLRYEFVPARDNSRLHHVGTYKRQVPVSLERMYENALDWAHLPHLHSASFNDIQCLAAGAWGWHATVTGGSGVHSELELLLDTDCRRWITRNLDGPNVGAEIWTHVFVVNDRVLDLVIDFFVPDVPAAARDKVGLAYARQYEQLYDEDVQMMTERQRQLDRRLDSVDRSQTLTLEAPSPQAGPVPVEFDGRAYRLEWYQDRWILYPALCPHQLGPLHGPINQQGEVVCPWHGYRFDVVSGDATSGGHCRFGPRPQVIARDERITISWDID